MVMNYLFYWIGFRLSLRHTPHHCYRQRYRDSSDTSTKRCMATIQGDRVWAMSKTMLSVMAAKR